MKAGDEAKRIMCLCAPFFHLFSEVLKNSLYAKICFLGVQKCGQD